MEAMAVSRAAASLMLLDSVQVIYSSY